jgi:hypothetical protein
MIAAFLHFGYRAPSFYPGAAFVTLDRKQATQLFRGGGAEVTLLPINL